MVLSVCLGSDSHFEQFGGLDFTGAGQANVGAEEVFAARHQAFGNHVVDNSTHLSSFDTTCRSKDVLWNVLAYTESFNVVHYGLFESGDDELSHFEISFVVSF